MMNRVYNSWKQEGRHEKPNDTPMEDFQALYNRQVNRVYRLALDK